MAIFNSYVSLPEGTCYYLVVGKLLVAPTGSPFFKGNMNTLCSKSLPKHCIIQLYPDCGGGLQPMRIYTLKHPDSPTPLLCCTLGDIKR